MFLSRFVTIKWCPLWGVQMPILGFFGLSSLSGGEWVRIAVASVVASCWSCPYRRKVVLATVVYRSTHPRYHDVMLIGLRDGFFALYCGGFDDHLMSPGAPCFLPAL